MVNTEQQLYHLEQESSKVKTKMGQVHFYKEYTFVVKNLKSKESI